MEIETELEGATRLLAEGEERLRGQMELVSILVFEGKTAEAATDLCQSTRKTIREIQTHIDYLRDTANRTG